jgi:hypothetical protein
MQQDGCRQYTLGCHLYDYKDTVLVLLLCSPEEFLTLDDTIVNHIKAAARCKGAHSCVKQATQILQRLQRHDTFYQLAAEAELPAQPVEQHNNGSSSSDGGSGSSSRLSVDDLVRCQDQGGVAGVVLRARDLRLQHYNINYCL